MSNKEQLFTGARNTGQLVTVAHGTKNGGHRRRVDATVERVSGTYVVLHLSEGGYRTVIFDTITHISLRKPQ